MRGANTFQILLAAAGAAVALYHLYAAIAGLWPFQAWPIIGTYTHRHLHLGLLLCLFFALQHRKSAGASRLANGLLAVVCLAATLLTVVMGEGILERSTAPSGVDLLLGLVFIGLVLEATRRSTGPVMPVIAVFFVLYVLLGAWLAQPWGHRGYGLERIVGHLFMTPEGMFGTPIGVSSTLIILFTIYGSVLMSSGSAEFFVNLSLRLFGRSRHGTVRAVTLSSFLLGGPSGSGVATTILIGNVAHPMLARAGYRPEQMGGFLAAGGLGAVLSPPVLGSAAFVLAEFLAISYLDVIKMVLVPTLIYYACLIVIAERISPESGPALLATDNTQWQPGRVELAGHVISIASVLAFLAVGFSAEVSAVLATLTAFICWMCMPSFPGLAALVPTLAAGATRAIPVAALCACAGLIIGSISLTGLGLKLGGIMSYYADADLLLITLMAAIVIMVVGLAVPITGSYIICAVVVAPALIAAGVPAHVAHMFIFYFAVLSEVSPPTAMAPFAAAAITGGNPIATTMQTWRFTCSIAIVPFVAILEPMGPVLLLDLSVVARPHDLVWFVLVYIAASLALIGALSSRLRGWPGRTTRGLLLCGSALLYFPHTMGERIGLGEGQALALGAAVCLVPAILSARRRRRILEG